MTHASLSAEVGKLATPVGLVRAMEGSAARMGLAAGGDLWIGGYAWLLLWPVDGASAGAIRDACVAAENHLDRVMPPESAQPGTVVDGYAALILASPPDAEARAMARQVELSPRICRKHVVWPENGGWDKRLACVTLLALPSDGATHDAEMMAADGTPYPVLPPDQAGLVDRVRSSWKQAMAEDLAHAGLEDDA